MYLTTHYTHNRQKSTPPAGFEPKISAGERPQKYALDRTATGTGYVIYWFVEFLYFRKKRKQLAVQQKKSVGNNWLTFCFVK